MNILITGSDGFIGRHISDYLKKDNIFGLDLKNEKLCRTTLVGDVRDSNTFSNLPRKIDLIINLAAIHREPGHSPDEYFDTNINGAKNICAFAEKVNCKRIIFTSSISPYGIGEYTKDENTDPRPATAYGESKLQAERIHLKWQEKDPLNRILTIVRPGVVYGDGEGGNMTRLVKAVKKGLFFYMSNKNTSKAGVYVKELINMIFWVHNKQLSSDISNNIIFNATLWPNPTIGDYVQTICLSSNIKRYIPSAPYSLLIFASYMLEIFYFLFRKSNPFSPVRIRKLIRPNLIKPSFLIKKNYKYSYSLKSSFTDWKRESTKDWS